MQKDQLLTRRRALLTGAAVGGAAGTAGLLAKGSGTEAARPAAPAAGAQAAGRPLQPSAYRLRPLTGYGPPRADPGGTPVRSAPLLRVSGRGAPWC